MHTRKAIIDYWNRRGHEIAKEHYRLPKSPLYVWKTQVVNDVVHRCLPRDGWLLKCDLWNEGLLEDSWFDLRHFFHSRDLELVGVDIAKSTCRYAKQRTRNVHVVVADLRFLPFREHAFKVVLDISTFDHIAPTDVITVLSQIKHVLNGVFLTIFHQEERLHVIKTWYYRLWERVKHERLGSFFRLKYFFNVRWMQHSLRHLGFHITFERPLDVGAWFPFTNSLMKRWRDFANILNRMELTRFPFASWMAGYWVIISTIRR